MVGPTLSDIREHIGNLASRDGQYYVVCGRTGGRPVPPARSRFPGRTAARAAARATEQYRSTLRRYDQESLSGAARAAFIGSIATEPIAMALAPPRFDPTDCPDPDVDRECDESPMDNSTLRDRSDER